MTSIARLDAELNVGTAPPGEPCSVLWILPDESTSRDDAFEGLPPSAPAFLCRAFLCLPGTALLQRKLSSTAGNTLVGEGRLELPGAHSLCEAVDVDDWRDAAFWRLFTNSTYGRQVCAGLFRTPPSPDARWVAAAFQLAIVTGSFPFWRLASAGATRDVLLRAFLGEAALAGVLPVVKIVPEMCGAGLAVTGSAADIDALEQQFATFSTYLDETDVRHSVELGGAWPL